MKEIEAYRLHLRGVSGFDSKGCVRVAGELNEDDLTCLYYVTIGFHEREEAKRLKAYQILKLRSELQSDVLMTALQDMNPDEVAEIYDAINKRLSTE